MKVVSQLARHFWMQGALSPEQAEYLVHQGFVKAETLGLGANGRLGVCELA
ncbi:MAG: hypothetical protein P4L84_20780 [Isosphaeraceae bacterium]|nr:hypothetical protein [Isosphaeraceae bacterium]